MRHRSVAKTVERTKKLVYVALFAALTAVLSQISIPLPSGVPLTLQTFAVAAAGFFLGWKSGLFAVAVYIALGACGVPVFAGFTGGAYKLVALTGGFVWGFLALLGLAVCHMIGVGQFALVTGNPLGASALAVSVPYIAKDVLSVLLAAAVVRAAGQRLRPSSAAAGRAVQGQIGHLS